MLDAFSSTPKGFERVAYLDGVRWKDQSGSEHGVVTTLVIPDAQLSPGNYRVVSEGIRRASEHLFDHGLVRLAQIHTHGNDWIGHSRTDDERAYSQRNGAVSIVLPFHATHRPSPLEGGVHVRTDGGWIRIEPAVVVRQLVSNIDQRQAVEQPTKPQRHARGRFPWSRKK